MELSNLSKNAFTWLSASPNHNISIQGTNSLYPDCIEWVLTLTHADKQTVLSRHHSLDDLLQYLDRQMEPMVTS